jgi:hypothetical protein
MIFARRALQRRLDELRAHLDADAVSKLVSRLNKPGKDRLAVMWEVATLHALSSLGKLQHEAPLESGKQPDITFDDGELQITADVTTVSDEGLHDQNPWREFSDLIEKEKARLGFPIGGTTLEIESKTQRTSRGARTVLRLPEKKKLREFVRDIIAPELKSQIDQGMRILSLDIEDDSTAVRIRIDPSGSPFNSTSYAAYDLPLVLDRNPLYSALHSKAGQLRGASGLKGVIVGDGDSKTLAGTSGVGGLNGRAIAQEFLRQHSSMHFVLLLSVREKSYAWYQPHQRKQWLEADLIFSKTNQIPVELELLFRRMLEAFPKPVQMPINAAYRAREDGFGWGHHGGYKMSGQRLKVSAREVLEVLAGRRTAQEINELDDELSRGDSSGPNTMPRLMEHYLSRGQLPVSISIVKTDENDNDDWIEFEFGPPDPAIVPFA